MKKLITIIGLATSFFAHAQEDDAAALAKKLANPLASLISVPLQNNLDFGVGALDGTRFTLNVQPVIPIKLSEKLNLITRTIVPIVSQTNITGVGKKESGLSDVTATAFLAPSVIKNGITWGAGPAILIPTGTEEVLTTKKWAVGPSAILLKQTESGFTYGALVNQLWSFAGDKNRSDVNQLYVNPFFAYNWKSGAGMSYAMDWTQNWEAGKTNLWASLMFSGVTTFGKQKVQLAIGPRLNLVAPKEVKSDWGFRGTLFLLF